MNTTPKPTLQEQLNDPRLTTMKVKRGAVNRLILYFPIADNNNDRLERLLDWYRRHAADLLPTLSDSGQASGDARPAQ